MVRDARRIGRWLAVLLAAQGAISLAGPQGTAFTYQGQLKDLGVPVDGQVDFIFGLWDALASGNPVGSSVELLDVDVVDGLFTVQLDFGGAAFAGEARWLEIKVRPTGYIAYTTLSPRQPLNAMPYALYALSGPGGGGGYWAANGADIYATNTGNVGVGSSTPAAKLHVGSSNARFYLQDDDDPLSYMALHDNGSSQALLYKTTASGQALLDIDAIPQDGVSDTDIRFFRHVNSTGSKNVIFNNGDGTVGASHILGMAGLDSGLQISGGNLGVGTLYPAARLHVLGIDQSLNASALYGEELIVEDAEAVLGLFSNPGGSYGSALGLAEINGGDLVDKWTLYRTTSGSSQSSQLRFSYGSNAAPHANPVHLALSADGSVGIGTTSPTCELDVAGSIRAVDADAGTWGYNTGVAAYATEPAYMVSNTGVHGEARDGFINKAVEARAEGGAEFQGTNYGVFAVAQYGWTDIAVYGTVDGDDPDDRAGYFGGDVTVTGTLYEGGGSFTIDHPLDPQNKILQHSFVESPDMMNIYNGNVVTDERGYATITLPEWFEALNRDFRYQLTVLDESDSAEFVQAKVVRKIDGNEFTIRTSRPQVEVSWQATGIRQDPFANANRIQVEVDKPPHEHGLYLHPKARGLSEELGRDYQRERAVRERQQPQREGR